MLRFYEQYFIFFLIFLLYKSLEYGIKNIQNGSKYRLAHGFTYLIYANAIIGVYLMNLWNLPLLIYAIGILLNWMVMTANHGFMPVDINKWCPSPPEPEKLEIKFDEISKMTRVHMRMSSSTKLNRLGDIFPPDGHSIGDKLIFHGSNLIGLHIALLIPFYIFRFIFGF